MAKESEKTEELLLDFISYLLKEGTICEDNARIFQLQAESYSKGVIEPTDEKNERCPCDVPFDSRWCDKHKVWN